MHILKRIPFLLLKNQNIQYAPVILSQKLWKTSVISLKTIHEKRGLEVDFENYKVNRRKLMNVLMPYPEDPLITKINEAKCVQDVLHFMQNYRIILNHTHLTQVVFVLWDLQKIFYDINSVMHADKITVLMRDYVDQLVAVDEFKELLTEIKVKIDDFDVESLSCVLYYLHRIGLKRRDETMQLLLKRMEFKLQEDKPSLSSIARFLVSLFDKSNSNLYFTNKDIISSIYQYLDKCETLHDLKLITISLNTLNEIVTPEFLIKYKDKVKEMIGDGRVHANDTDTILKIVLFLNYPQWRNQNTPLISECIKLLNGNLHTLSVEDLLHVWEIFKRTEEPGGILLELQRCANKFVQELDDDSPTFLEVRLRLISCIKCFSPTTQRQYIAGLLERYLGYCKDGKSLIQFFQLLKYTKYSEPDLCKKYWSQLLNIMEHDVNFRKENILKVSNNYMLFYQIVKFRNLKFEKRINQWLEGEIEQGIANHIPGTFAVVASFSLAYGNDVAITNFIVQKLKDNWKQYNYVECYVITRGLEIGHHLNPTLSQKYSVSLKSTLLKCIESESVGDLSLNKINMLLRSIFQMNEGRNEIVKKLLEKYQNFDDLSSKVIKNISVCLITANAFLPDVVEKLVDYVCEYKENLLAFNAENIAYLCYNFGYTPKNSQTFFQVLANIMFRDQERINGLTFLQSCLAMCFFNSLPDTLIKQVFNTSFLDKLDVELVNCYAKDVYPSRVRLRLMQLNRVICIDYPQANVPWFHQKYIDDYSYKANLSKMGEDNINHKVQESLLQIFKNPDLISANVITPYGYLIDFVINLQENQDVFDRVEDNTNKIAVLLLPSNAYTKINVQMRGQYQAKIRHLEIFGYRVIVINYAEWNSLIFGEEKVDYINELLNEIKR